MGGYSQGTIQMFYGLAHLEEQFHAQNLYKAVLLAPCFVAAFASELSSRELNLVFNKTSMTYQDHGVYAINGPNWDRDLQTLCDVYPKELCEYFEGLSGI